jgi:hypothetical protein
MYFLEDKKRSPDEGLLNNELNQFLFAYGFLMEKNSISFKAY